MKKREKKGVILINLGTPQAPTVKAVRTYLKEFLSDSRVIEMPRIFRFFVLFFYILPFRARASAKNYQKIWTKKGSPLLLNSQKLCAAIKKEFKNQKEILITLGMRYGLPSIPESLTELQKKNCDEILVIPMYPQYSSPTVGSVFFAVTKELQSWRSIPEIKFIKQYYDNPSYILAIANSIRRKQKNSNRPRYGKKEKRILLFSYHGLPMNSIQKGDPYHTQCHHTSLLAAKELQLNGRDYKVSFQSRFGPQEWLKPYTDTVLQELPSKNVEHVDIVCPAFSVDCIETLEEIQMEGEKIFQESGGKSYEYIPCLNDSQEQVALYREIIEGK